MKKIFQVLGSIVLAIVISAFLAPILHQFLPFKFEKILNRLLIISTFIICFTFVRIRKPLLEECGFGQGKAFKFWTLGFIVSLSVLSLLIFLELKIGALTFDPDFKYTLSLLLTSLATGITVGFIEEFFFRGFLFINLKKSMNTITAVLVTSAIYSAVHFLKSGRPVIDWTPTMWDSFRVLGDSLTGFMAWNEFWPGFVGLFLFGVILSLVFLRTKSLFMSMGIHAGAVSLLKFATKLYSVNPNYSAVLYGGRGFYSGMLGWLFIALIGVIIYLMTALIFSRKGRQYS